jgi:hypothetical protein
MAALNYVGVEMADIDDAYLTSPITKKVWTMFDPELGDDVRKRVLLVRTLYGLKSAGAGNRNHLADDGML